MSLTERVRKGVQTEMTIQTVRVTTELFLPDSELRALLKLEREDIIMAVRRAEATRGLDLGGFLVTVLKGDRK